MSEWAAWVRSQLAEVEAAGQWRAPIPFQGSMRAVLHGREVINFAANDYLGLSTHPQVIAAAHDAISRWGGGSGAARLVTGTRMLHEALEAELAQWQRTDRALVFSSGFAANLGVMSALGTEHATIFSDALNHASIIDGCRLAKARTRVFAHNDLGQLDDLLRTTNGLKLVVTEAVFSMDGDEAPVPELSQLCAEHGALLVLDEAHAVFQTTRTFDCDHLVVGTLSKTLGSLGGWVAGSKRMIDLLINRARSFVYTTALSPADTASASAALAIYRGEEGAQLRATLRRNVDAIRARHPSAIIPLYLGSEAAALQAARALLDHGIHIPAIRPPTVPVGTSRLRLTVSAAHTADMIAALQSALDSVLGEAR